MQTRKILLDTNVWVDYFINRSSLNKQAVSLIGLAHASEFWTLCTAVTSTNNIYYAIRQFLKQEARNAEGNLTETSAVAANEAAWSCLSTLRKLSFVVPSDMADMIEADLMRGTHSDYEDNLVAAAAKRVGAEFVATSDRQMLERQPFACVDIEEAIKLLGT